MSNVVYPEFRDQFGGTNYPFVDSATLSSMDSTLVLPASLFIDASFYMPTNVDSVYLRSIVKSDTKCTITVNNIDNSCSATGTLTLTQALPQTLYLKTDTGLTVGCLVSDTDRLAYFSAINNGSYTFLPAATQFTARCTIPMPSLEVTAINVEGSLSSETLHGDVWFTGGTGIWFFRPSPSVIGMVITGGRGRDVIQSTCASSVTEPKYIQTINNNESDMYGNIQLNVCSSVSTSEYRIHTKSENIELRRL